MANRYICTYFDYSFLPRGLALYHSIIKNCPDFLFYVLALDDATYSYFNEKKLDKVVVIDIEDYKRHFKVDINKYQDKKQFYFSITPNICLYVLELKPDIDILTYLDADVFLFNSIEHLYDELGTASIGIASHNLPKWYKAISNHHGHYNVGVNCFRNDKTGIECLTDWKNDCESWYPNKPEYPLDYFSDQIFLDSWTNKYKNLIIFKQKGIDVAPWNASKFKFSLKNNIFFVDNEVLIIFHFSSLKKIGKNKWNTNSAKYFLAINNSLKNVYLEYIKVVESYEIKQEENVEFNYKPSSIRRFIQVFNKKIFKENIKVV